MRQLSNNNKGFVFERVFPLVLSKDLFLLALKKRGGGKSFFGFSENSGCLNRFMGKFVDDLIQELSRESYVPDLFQREFSIKSGGGTGLNSLRRFRDELVQEVVRMVLEAVYSGSFSRHSFGVFRDKGFHAALREVQVSFLGVK